MIRVILDTVLVLVPVLTGTGLCKVLRPSVLGLFVGSVFTAYDHDERQKSSPPKDRSKDVVITVYKQGTKNCIQYKE